MKEKGDSSLWRFCGLCRNPDPDISVPINALWEASGSVEGTLLCFHFHMLWKLLRWSWNLYEEFPVSSQEFSNATILAYTN